MKWNGLVLVCFSYFRLLAGERQGGLLSPFLFAIFIDSAVDKVRATNAGCYLYSICMSTILYVDDILLIVPSIHALQCLMAVCEKELLHCTLSLAAQCIVYGPVCVCESATMITQNCVHRSSPNWVCI